VNEPVKPIKKNPVESHQPWASLNGREVEFVQMHIGQEVGGVTKTGLIFSADGPAEFAKLKPEGRICGPGVWVKCGGGRGGEFVIPWGNILKVKLKDEAPTPKAAA
jgi:hypothetical protein